MLVFLSVHLYPINVKTAGPIGPKFLWNLAWPQGRFMDNQIFKQFASIKIRFLKILKIQDIFLKIRDLFLFVFVLQENMFIIEIEDGREKPSRYIKWNDAQEKTRIVFVYFNALFTPEGT